MQAPISLQQAQGIAITLTDRPIVRSILAIVFAFVVFAIFIAIIGRNPVEIYVKMFEGTLGSKVGLSEVGVRMIPFVLTALAASIPARVGLINVGGEGQLYIGAWAATGVALYVDLPAIWLMLPAMAAAGFAGGAIWGGIAILLRHWRNVNEVISTLLSNYVAILFVNFFVFGAWKNPTGFGYPYTSNFEAESILPAIADTRLHFGLVLPVIGIIATYLFLSRTRWGANMRAIGGNPDAARRRGIPVLRYIIIAMLVGGGLAGLAGMSEVSGIQHHLRPGISNNLGFMGFLASWMANHNQIAIIGTSFLIAAIVVGGDVLQFSGNLPSAAMLILIGLVLFSVLGFRRMERKAE
jgi:simple sugar transport system permease protein